MKTGARKGLVGLAIIGSAIGCGEAPNANEEHLNETYQTNCQMFRGFTGVFRENQDGEPLRRYVLDSERLENRTNRGAEVSVKGYSWIADSYFLRESIDRDSYVFKINVGPDGVPETEDDMLVSLMPCNRETEEPILLR